jgi:hypothetical protein
MYRPLTWSWSNKPDVYNALFINTHTRNRTGIRATICYWCSPGCVSDVCTHNFQQIASLKFIPSCIESGKENSIPSSRYIVNSNKPDQSPKIAKLYWAQFGSDIRLGVLCFRPRNVTGHDCKIILYHLRFISKLVSETVLKCPEDFNDKTLQSFPDNLNYFFCLLNL